MHLGVVVLLIQGLVVEMQAAMIIYGPTVSPRFWRGEGPAIKSKSSMSENL